MCRFNKAKCCCSVSQRITLRSLVTFPRTKQTVAQSQHPWPFHFPHACSSCVSPCVGVWVCTYHCAYVDVWLHRSLFLINMQSTSSRNKLLLSFASSVRSPSKHLSHLTLNNHSNNVCWGIILHKAPSVQRFHCRCKQRNSWSQAK